MVCGAAVRNRAWHYLECEPKRVRAVDGERKGLDFATVVALPLGREWYFLKEPSFAQQIPKLPRTPRDSQRHGRRDQ